VTIRLDIGHYLPIGDTLEQSLYLQPFSRYWPLRSLWSRPWHFRVTWRHGSRDHSIPRGPFPLGTPLSPSRRVAISSRFWDNGHAVKSQKVMTLTFQGHVTSSVTWALDSRWSISYWWSFGPKSLSLTVSEIFRPKHHVVKDTMLNSHCACAYVKFKYIIILISRPHLPIHYVTFVELRDL